MSYRNHDWDDAERRPEPPYNPPSDDGAHIGPLVRNALCAFGLGYVVLVLVLLFLGPQ
jgi:hypothetical protein